jgi:uncharacterized coiled-coil protein SlyX
MFRAKYKGLGAILLGIVPALLGHAGTARAGDAEAELRALIEQQNRQIQEQNRQLEALKQRLDSISASQTTSANADAKPPAPAAGASAASDKKDDKKAAVSPDEVKKITADYLKDNPGAGLPPGVQTGFFSGSGFVIRSPVDPEYPAWGDESRVPFELRIRGRLQGDYYGYFPTDDANHETGAHQQAQNSNSHRFARFSQLEVKRLRLIFEGTVFDPNLRYHFELDGNTRGIGGIQNNKDVQTAGAFDPNGSAVSGIGGGDTVDHTVRLFSAYVAYDFHGCSFWKGCGAPCPDDQYKYAPTYTLIFGKFKPTMSAEEWMAGSGGEQMVEYSMADWYFDADDDNLLMGAALQVRAFDDRFFLQAMITNGNESQFANTQMDDYPGFVLGTWYDLGGNWNDKRHRWDLFGDTFSDIDYSCNPVFRIAGAADIVPQDRRSLYGDAEQSRVFVSPGAPGGTRLINLLNGDGLAGAAGTYPFDYRGRYAEDRFDYFTYEAFAGMKWRGFSLTTDWWFRDLTDFKAAPGENTILYTFTNPTTGKGVTAVFPAKSLYDYGTQLQAGYFLIPHKLEVVARWSWIRGDSGDVIGNTNAAQPTIALPSGVSGGASTLIHAQVRAGAFSNYHDVQEYAVGVNYFFWRELVKWQTDFSIYQGGNPAGGAASPAGFIPGEDGWMIRTQIQLGF